MEIFKKYGGVVLFGVVIFLVVYSNQPGSPIKSAIELSSFKKKIDACIPADRMNFNFEKSILDLNAVFDPLFNRAATLAGINRLTDGVRAAIDNNADPEVIMERFNHFFFYESSFIFDVNANALLYEGSAGNSFSSEDFLNYQSIERVIMRRKGICLSLSVLYLIIAERLKLPVYGVVVPGHIFVRYEDDRHSGINSETTFGGAEYYGYKGMTGTEFLDKDTALYNKRLDNYTVLFAVLNNFSILYSVMKQGDKAEYLLKKSIEIAPEFPEAHNNLGMLYAAKGRLNDAMEELKEAYRLFPGSSVTQLHLGLVYLADKKFTQAEEYLNKALKNKRTAGQAAKALENLKKERDKA